MTPEILIMWLTLTAYVAAAVMFVFGVIFLKESLTRAALTVTALGLIPHTAAIVVRWMAVGHGPYIGYYEVANALTYFTVVFFVVAGLRNRRLSALGIGIMPVAVLLIGGAMLAPKAGLPMTPQLASYWLFIHVAFANLAFAAFAGSFGFAVIYLLRERSKAGVWTRRLEKMPKQSAIENSMSRFALAGFLLWGIMIVTGAIWANEAWGRYWSWDPIETWSLVVWLIYAVFLHVRFALRWRDQRLAWFAFAAMPVALFCLVGIPTVFSTIHGGYIGGVDG
ncbi:MAG: cytochrome c biogenesis protein CcsA [Coriobacteriia bacterium]